MNPSRPNDALAQMLERDADAGVDVFGVEEVRTPPPPPRPARPPFEIEAPNWFEETP